MIEVKKKEGESVNSLLYRFSKIIRQSGVLKEAKKRRFFSTKKNKRHRKDAALYRIAKRKEIEKLRKLGKLNNNR